MSEVLGGSARMGPPKYLGQPQPVLRNREEAEEWRRVQIDNRMMHTKLDEIRREPPATYHAPKGYASLYNGHVYRKLNHGKADVIGLPPGPLPKTGDMNGKYKKEQQRLLNVENERIAQKLHEIYSSHPSDTSHHEQFPTLDCTERWQERTTFYRPQSAPSTSARNPNSTLDHHQPGRKVPKAQAMAMCSGCSAKGFYHADGVALFPCPKCKTVFYCSKSCMEVDRMSHKQLCCSHVENGAWTAWQRPAHEFWVNNAAMGAARRALEKLPPPSTPEEDLERAAQAKKVYDKARAKELAADKAQAEIEKRAYWGLDGPRPCMYMGGKRIGGP